jgi:hypothetical protein
MFAYSPTPDRSGEILASGQMQAAQTNAQMMNQLGSDIGGALKSIGSSYGDAMEKRADGESAYNALQQMAQMYPSMNKMVKGLSELDPRTRGMASAQVLGNFGALSQFAMAGMRDSTQRAGQDLTAMLPDLRNRSDANSLVAGGEGTVMLPPAPEGAYTPTMTPSPDAMSAAGAWYNQSRQTPVSISGGAMRPFYRSVR